MFRSIPARLLCALVLVLGSSLASAQAQTPSEAVPLCPFVPSQEPTPPSPVLVAGDNVANGTFAVASSKAAANPAFEFIAPLETRPSTFATQRLSAKHLYDAAEQHRQYHEFEQAYTMFDTVSRQYPDSDYAKLAWHNMYWLALQRGSLPVPTYHGDSSDFVAWLFSGALTDKVGCPAMLVLNTPPSQRIYTAAEWLWLKAGGKEQHFGLALCAWDGSLVFSSADVAHWCSLENQPTAVYTSSE